MCQVKYLSGVTPVKALYLFRCYTCGRYVLHLDRCYACERLTKHTS